MPILNLSLLGPFEASLDQQPIYSFRTQKAQALLIYLAMEKGYAHPQDELAALLWPDLPIEAALVNLQQTIHRLREAIPLVSVQGRKGLAPLVLVDMDTVQLNPKGMLRLDVDEFTAQIGVDAELAITHYRGDFLENFRQSDSAAYEAWADGNREELRSQALQALDTLTQRYLQQEDYARAQAYAWRQLEINPLREPAYRQLMVSLAHSGQRNAALAQFQVCQQRLVEGLGREPEPETIRVFEQIQSELDQQVQSSSPQFSQVPGKQMPVFMLTDIEGSTRLWDMHRQAMLTALLRHNAILEEQINRHNGRILELRGDGVKAVFEVGDPLNCVIAIQKELAQTDWGEIGKLKIRIGLHGVPAVRKDFDYFKKDKNYYGPVLNHTARIMDAGWGGQILVSEQVHNTFPLPPGASWQDFGFHELKSLDHPVHIFGLTHPDLSDQSFEPLRTLSTQAQTAPGEAPRLRHNLTFQSSAFIGRQREMADLDDFLADPELRLVTIVGPGGMGKTRLASAAAEKQVERRIDGKYLFPDGVFFVPLVSLDEPGQIIPAISKALNVPIEASQSSDTMERASQTTTSQRESLVGFLDSKKLLLILDNFEHLLDGANILAELLVEVPTLHALVTSRERLHIREEQVYHIQGLEFPAIETPQDPSNFTAMEFFLHSASRSQPGFKLAPGDLTHLTRICQLVGGMPLGLELAASWVDVLSIKEIASEIQKSIDFLETDLRDIPDRHRNIRAVFDSSWKCLGEEEKRIFPRLTVFRGSFTRTTAEKIAQATLRTLANLVNKSLVQFDQRSNRYQIHAVLRQIGSELLAASPRDEMEFSRRHSAFWCAEVEQVTHLLMSGQTQTAMNRLEFDIANIRAAWDWAVCNTQLDLVNLALNGMCVYHDWSWQLEEGLAVCEAALGMLRSRDNSNDQDAILSKRLLAKILAWQGYYEMYSKNNQSIRLLEQSQRLIDELIESGVDARDEKGLILFYQGYVNYLSGDYKASKQCFTQTLGLSKEIGLQWMVIRSLMMLGDVARNAGAPGEAKTWYEQCLAESRLQGNLWGEISSLHDLGWAARNLISYEESKNYYEESLALAKKCDDRWEVLHVLESLGFHCLFLGQFDQAIDLFQQSVSISKELGAPYRSLPSQEHIGVANWLSGDFSQAEKAILETVTMSQGLTPSARIFPLICYAEFLVISGRTREAVDQRKILVNMTQEIFLDRFTDGRLSRVLGWIALAEGDLTEARQQFKKSVEIYQLNSDDEQIAWSQAGLAAVAILQNNWKEAQQLLTEALWTSFEIKGFIPLLFTLPMICLYLSKDEPDQARYVYSLIQASPFMANARFFQETIYSHLPDEIKSPVKKLESSPSELQNNLWLAASKVLSAWMQVWMTHNETIQQE